MLGSEKLPLKNLQMLRLMPPKVRANLRNKATSPLRKKALHG
jgi:hypothetical protein